MLYFDDSYLFSAQAAVTDVGSDEKGKYIILDKTPFYPQGGGQPYDLGTIDDASVEAVRWVEEKVRHYTSQDPSSLMGKTVDCAVDGARRIRNSRCHTAGHLLSHIVEMIYPQMKAVKGHHYEEGAYVEFTGSSPVDLDRINQELVQAIAQNFEVRSWLESTKRFVQIGSYNPWPCGGTHVKTVGELGEVAATKQKSSKEILRINYNVS